MSQQPQTVSVRVPIWLKLALLTSLFAAAPAVGIGLGLMNINAEAIKVSSRELRLAVAEDIGRTIEAELNEAQDGIDAVGRALTDRSVAAPVRQKLATTLVSSTLAIDHAAIYGPKGVYIDTIREQDAKLPKAPKQLDAALRKRAEQKGAAIGEVVKDPAGTIRVVAVVPMTVKQGDGLRTTGYVMSHVPIGDVQQRVVRLSTFRFDKRPDALFVVDAKRRIVANPDAKRLLQREEELPLLVDVEKTLLKQGVAQSGEYTSSSQGAMLASVVPLRAVPWVVVAQVPRDIAYASLVRMRLLTLAATLVALLLAIIGALVLARRITTPIDRLMELAGAIAARRFDTRVEVKTGDELAVLAHTMSESARQLKESEEQLLAEQEIRQDLGRYLPGELVERVVSRDQSMSLGGERRNITVLFADIVGFTGMCDQLSPENVVAILNELFTITTEIVFRHGGTVDKFIGDCVMAFWGAPDPIEDHAYRALLAAEDMINWLDVGNAGWQAKYGVTIHLAIGVATGDAIVGNLGSETRMEYTAIGDSVNTAARLEAVARPQQILCTEATVRAVGDDFDTAVVGQRQLSGQDHPTLVYEVRI